MSQSVGLCHNCAGRLAEGAATCRYCSAAVDGSPRSAMAAKRSVNDAVETWARSVFGAPRRAGDLITTIDVRDEVLERVATEVVHREIREQRLPTNRRDQSAPRIAPHEVDPFGLSTATLRAESEHVGPCNYCSGAGVCRCSPCHGAGRAACDNCGGSGKEVKHYQKSSRLINCKICRASGTVRCGGCGGSGSVTCTTCSGSGHQLVWLTYDQESRVVVEIPAGSPIVTAHRQLAERRFLNPGDLEAFSVLASEQADGPVVLQGYRGGDDAILRASVAALDPRLERVNKQQYLKLSVVRRDARYEMCGIAGSVVLSGKDLVAARNKSSARPITQRLYAWGALSLIVGVLTAIASSGLRGSSPYFNETNPVITLLWLLGLALAIPALGGVLRALRPGLRIIGLRPIDRYVGGASIAAIAGFTIFGLAARSRIAEVEKALSAGATSRARLVVEALRETKGATSDVLEADDAVRLAEARTMTGDPRLKVLDEVGARRGGRATEATALARADRLAALRSSLDAKKPEGALAQIDRWFASTWKGDPEVAELRAAANDIVGAQCADSPCHLRAASLAQSAAASPEREQRAAGARSKLLADLSTVDVPGEDVLTRTKRLRALSVTATKARELANDDTDVIDAAKTASSWADAERGKVALVGADLPIVEELLGVTSGIRSRPYAAS